jgi:hypothetical protein
MRHFRRIRRELNQIVIAATMTGLTASGGRGPTVTAKLG